MLTLDAMRGGAAIAVVIYHAVGVAPQTAPSGWQRWMPMFVGGAVHFGYAGVFLFFVISGFCIHLFWARTLAAGTENPEINFYAFWKRRVRRLYPPYLAALMLYLIVAGFQSPLKVTASYLWDVLLHLLMLHNLDPRTTYSINAAFWTLAIEEQLYLAYFLLLFLRKRYGWTRTLIVCALARIAWLIMGRALSHFYGIEIPISESAATNWLTWAFGAMSVEAALGLVELPRWCYRLRWSFAALLSAMLLAETLPYVDSRPWIHDPGWLLMHPLWGIGFFVLVNYAVRVEKSWRASWSITPQAIRLLAALGLFSYSLYLTHLLVLMKWYWFGFTRFHIPTISLLIMTPLSVIFAYLFFRLFERPFMNTRPRSGSRGRKAATTNIAPAEAVTDAASA